MEVKIYLDPEGVFPAYQHKGDAGADVCSLEENFMLGPGEIKLVKTGIYMSMPEGIECQIRPRSGLALKGITIVNSPGTVDSGYLGENKIILINHSKNMFSVEKGMRIGQFVFNKYESATFVQVKTKEELGTSDRGEGGFGSSGNK